MSAILPAIAAAAWLAVLGWPAARRAGLGLGAVAVGLWGVAGLYGTGGFTLRLPASLPALAFSPVGAGAVWLLLLGVLGIALSLLLEGPGAASGPGRVAARPATASLMHATLLAAALVVTAGTPFSLITAWEAMSALTFVLFVGSHPSRRVHAASRLLLLVSELGAAALYVAVVVSQGSGTSILANLGPGAREVIALLAVVAFGTKAALVPFQLWLPVAEPEAPGVVAGFLSGALTAVAVAALMRTLGWLDPAPLPIGLVLGALGLAGLSVGSLGALFAGDLKRVLAYGTIEALGAAFLALGLGLVLRSLNAPGQAATAVVGAMTLVFAHAGGKLCLFAVTGEIEAAGGGRRLDALGGLMARMPWSGATSLVGALGLAGVPPLGTFVGEWLLLESLFMPLPTANGVHVFLALLGAAVAILSAVSFTAYLRWYGVAFLGPARSRRAEAVVERGRWPRAGLVWALVPLVAAGVGTPWLVPLWQAAYAHGPAVILPLFRHPQLNATLVGVGAAVGRGLPATSGVVLTPNGAFAILSPWDLTWIALGVGAIAYALVRLFAPGMASPPRRVGPWAGGRLDYSAASTFTAESLSHPLRLSLAAWAGLRTETTTPAGQRTRRYRVRYRDRLWTLGYGRIAHLAAVVGRAAARSQSGSVSQYVASILAALVLAVVIASYMH